MSPDERSFLASVDAALRRARTLAIVEAAFWGAAAAAVSVLAGVLVAVAVAAIRLRGVSRLAIVRSLERASPDARNVFVTADELSRGRLAANAPVRLRVFADASARAQTIDRGRAVPARAAVVSAAGACIVWMLVFATSRYGPSGLVRTGGSAPRPSSGPARRGTMTVVVTIRPPSYTGLKESQATDPQELRGVEGSVAVLSIETAASTITVDHDGATRILARAPDGRFSDRLPLTRTGYVIVASDSGDRRTIPIVVSPDALPTVRMTAPGRDLVYAGGNASIGFTTHAADDFGLRSLTLRYTKVSGSGEDYQFTEGEIPLAVSPANARDWTGSATRTLAQLGLQEGDLLVYRAVASDARPGDGSASSDSYFIEISRIGVAAGDGFTLPEQETRYALSQQMLIVKTDRLAHQRGTMTAEQFADASVNLAVEQRRIRAEFVFMLGGEIEDEEVEAERSVELQAGRLANRGQGDLRAATIAMSQAEKLLTATNPTDALPAERDAVAALQRAFARDRYILRASPTRIDIDPKRRLSGDLSSALGWSRPIPDTPENRRTAQLQDLLQGVSGLAQAPDRSRTLVLAGLALRIDAQSAELRKAATILQQVADGWTTTTADARQLAIDGAAAVVAAETQRGLLASPMDQTAVAPGLRRGMAERVR